VGLLSANQAGYSDTHFAGRTRVSHPVDSIPASRAEARTRRRSPSLSADGLEPAAVRVGSSRPTSHQPGISGQTCSRHLVAGSALPVHPVVQHHERKAEDPERVLGAQFAVLHVHVELLGEALHGGRRQLSRLSVDIREVVAGVL
jgi:hypothetical protein